MGKCCKKRCCQPCPAGHTGPRGPTGSSSNFTFIDDIGTTIPLANAVITTGVGGNRTVGNNSNLLTVQDLRSLSSFVVGNDPNTSEYPSISSALIAAAAAGGGIIYLQKDSYTDSFTMINNVIISGQFSFLTGTITIPSDVGCGFENLNLTGGIVSQGSFKMYNCTIDSGSGIALDSSSSSPITKNNFVIINSSIDNNGFLSALRINGSGDRVLFDCFVGNRNLLGLTVEILPTGGIEIRNSYIAGNCLFRPSSTIVYSNFQGISGKGTVTLLFDSDVSNLGINFMHNKMRDSVLAVTWDGIVPYSVGSLRTPVLVNGNRFDKQQGGVLPIIVQNTPFGPTFPLIVFQDNVFNYHNINLTFINNTTLTQVLFINNYIENGIVNTNTNSGTVGQIIMLNNVLNHTPLSMNETYFYLNNNIIQNNIIVPITINYSSVAFPVEHMIISNYISNFDDTINLVTGNLSGLNNSISMINNVLSGNAVTTLFGIIVTPPANFNTNNNNANVHGSPQGSPYTGIITNI